MEKQYLLSIMSVSVFLPVIQHAKRMRCVIWSYVTCLVPPYFSTLSHKRHDFSEKELLNIKCVFLFSLQLVSVTSLILRRIQRDVTMNVKRSSCIVPTVLVILIRF